MILAPLKGEPAECFKPPRPLLVNQPRNRRAYLMATNQLDTDPRQPATAPNLAFDPDLGTYVRQESAAALDELDAEDREADRLADQWAGMDWRDKPIGPDTAIEILRGLPEVIESVVLLLACPGDRLAELQLRNSLRYLGL